MGRDDALAGARAHLDCGDFQRDLARRVAMPTASQDPAAMPVLRAYLVDEIAPSLQALGFTASVHDNPELGHTDAHTAAHTAAHTPTAGPLLIAHRHEDAALPTVLMYGHGDVIRGQDKSWTRGQGPWMLVQDGDRKSVV